jgi:hypothetical protein
VVNLGVELATGAVAGLDAVNLATGVRIEVVSFRRARLASISRLVTVVLAVRVDSEAVLADLAADANWVRV